MTEPAVVTTGDRFRSTGMPSVLWTAPNLQGASHVKERWLDGNNLKPEAFVQPLRSRIRRDVPQGYTIALARVEDLDQLPAIDLAAAQLLRGHAPESVLREATDADTFEAARRHGRLWVARAGHIPVGFELVKMLADDPPHLDEVDVAPAHGRRGLGTVPGLWHEACLGVVEPIVIDLSEVRTASALHELLAYKLAFPVYDGNWDAFDMHLNRVPSTGNSSRAGRQSRCAIGRPAFAQVVEALGSDGYRIVSLYVTSCQLVLPSLARKCRVCLPTLRGGSMIQ